MDKNTVIGFSLLAVLFIGYFYFANQGAAEAKAEKARMDSITNANKPIPAENTQFLTQDSTFSSGIQDTTGVQEQLEESTVVVENELLQVTFTNKGAQPALIALKKYNSQDGTPVKLVDENQFDRYSYAVNVPGNRSAQSASLMFEPAIVTKNNDGSTTVNFKKVIADGEVIVHQFTLKPNDYMIDWNIQLNGADRLLSQQSLNLLWQSKSMQQEKDVKHEKQQSQITFFEGNDFDYYNIISRNSYKFEKEIKWVSVKQQFFTKILYNNSGTFTSGEVNWKVPEDSLHTIVEATTNLRLNIPQGSVANMPLQLYYGPNDYHILKKYNAELENNVNLGQGFYSFVKFINRLFVLPLFDFFKSFISSFGIVILLLTIVIRLLISPLTYKSYLSGARMKALRPELDAIKKRLGDDQQGFAMEQMKLFKEAGVNPLGGCIPALLQIPIFFALFSFFNSSVDLRGESFLWATDLASYDSIIDLPFYIWGFGDHVSLFTILAAGTSMLISIYSMNMSPDQSNPMLKYMPYIFPIVMLGIFNSMPSALTWYYTVSNLITLILQFVIQKFIIDHNKILATIEANKKKPKKQSKWQDKLAEMQEAQKKMQEAQKKGR